VPAFVFRAGGVLSTPLSWLGTCNITPSPHKLERVRGIEPLVFGWKPKDRPSVVNFYPLILLESNNLKSLWTSQCLKILILLLEM